MSIRIESCTLDAFGPLQNLQLNDLDHPVVVLQGHNESGKTAFFHFLQTMFYGIYPTDAEKHPYAPRRGGPLKGTMRFRLADGTTYTVTRRLRSSPLGDLQNEEGEPKRIRNRTVPAAQHVPQSVYESVYALQLDDLMRLEGEAWDEVQDRLLGTLSVDSIRPAREVINELEDEATDRWRTDNRGKPEAKQLEQQRRELRDAAREARDRDAEVRRLKDEISEHTQRIEALKSEAVTLKGKQHRAERLVPVRRLLQQIEDLEAQAGDPSVLDALPDDPTDELDDLEARLSEVEARREEVKEKIDKHEAALDAWTESDERVLDHADDIRRWTRRLERHEQDRAALDEARREQEDAQRRLEAAASVLSTSWASAYAEPLRTLSMADLRERVKAYERAERRLRETRARAETVGLHAQARTSLMPWIAVAFLGVAVGGLGVVVSLPVAGVPLLGAAIALVGGLQAIAAWRHNRQLDTQEEQLNLEEKEAEAQQRADQVARLLDDLPLPSERLEQPSADLVSDLSTLQDALRERDAAARAAEEQAAVVEEAEAALHALARQCGHPENPGNRPPDTVVSALEQRLATAEARDEARAAAEEALPGLRSEADQLSDERSSIRERREAIVERLEALGDGDRAAGVEELEVRRTARQRAEASRDRLHREYPDWKERKAEIEEMEADDGTWTYTDEERARIEQRLDDIEEERRAEETTRAEKKKDVEHLQEKRSVGDIESELIHVERRLDEVREARDRRMLLAGLLRRADAEFRRKHQPDVIRRASDYLSSITEGRYERLVLDEQDNQLVVYESGGAEARSVAHPLSRGTLDQIYLALRLAIIDHLDADGERLPVFLDEVFVNWDASRRRAAFDLLSNMAHERQLFLFTCHPFFAEEVTRHLDATRIDLAERQPEETHP